MPVRSLSSEDFDIWQQLRGNTAGDKSRGGQVYDPIGGRFVGSVEEITPLARSIRLNLLPPDPRTQGWWRQHEDELTRKHKNPNVEGDDKTFWQNIDDADTGVAGFAKGIAHGMASSVTSTGVALGSVLKKLGGPDDIYNWSLNAGAAVDDVLMAEDPGFTHKLASGIGTVLTMLTGSGGLYAGGARAAAALGFGGRASVITNAIIKGGAVGQAAKVLGGTRGILQGGMMGAGESVMEAGGVIQQMVQQGASDDEAFEAAKRVLSPNVVAGMITNIGYFIPSGRLLKAGHQAIMEGFQENLQEEASARAVEGREMWTPDLFKPRHWEAMAIGGIIGGFTGVAFYHGDPLKKTPRSREGVPEGAATIFDDSNSDAVVELSRQARGMPDEVLAERIEGLTLRHQSREQTGPLSEQDALGFAVMHNELARREATKAIGDRHTDAELQKQLDVLGERVATKGRRAWDDLHFEQQNWFRHVADVLATKGNMNPSTGTLLAPYLGVSFNQQSSQNWKGARFDGRVSLETVGAGEDARHVVSAWAPDLSFKQETFTNESEARTAASELSEQIKAMGAVVDGVQQAGSQGQQQEVIRRESFEGVGVPPVTGPYQTPTQRVMGDQQEVIRRESFEGVGVPPVTGPYQTPTQRAMGDWQLSWEDQAGQEQAYAGRAEEEARTPEAQRVLGSMLGVAPEARPEPGPAPIAEDPAWVTKSRAMEILYTMGVKPRSARKSILFNLEGMPDTQGKLTYRAEDVVKEGQTRKLDSMEGEDLTLGSGPFQAIWESIKSATENLKAGDTQGYMDVIRKDPRQRTPARTLVENAKRRPPELQWLMDRQEAIENYKPRPKKTTKWLSDLADRVYVGAWYDEWLAEQAEPKKTGKTKRELRRTGQLAADIRRTLVKGAVPIAHRFLDKGVGSLKVLGKHHTKKGLYKILGENSIQGEDELRGFGEYLKMKMTLAVAKAEVQERAANPKSQQLIADDLRPELPKIEAAVKSTEALEPRYVKAADQVKAYANGLIDYLVEAEVLSEASGKRIKGRYEFYAPMIRLDKKSKMIGGGRVNSEARTEVRKMKMLGNWYNEKDPKLLIANAIMNPVEALVDNTVAMVQTGIGNHAKVALHKNGTGTNVRTVPYNKTGKVYAALKEAEKAGKSFEAQEDINLPDRLLALITAQKEIDADKESDELVFFEKGVLKKMEVPRAIYDLYTQNPSMGKIIDAWPMRVAQKMTAALRAGAVYTPEFTFRNPMRDIPATIIQTAEIFTNPQAFARFFKFFMAGVFSGVGVDNKLTASFRAAMDDWTRSGGEMADIVSTDRGSDSAKMKAFMTQGTTSPIKGVVYHYTSSWRNAASGLMALAQAGVTISENAVRVSNYQSRMQGLIAKESKLTGKELDRETERYMQLSILAALDSREGSLDFNRMGKQVRALNMLSPFFNAGLQGLDKMARSLVFGDLTVKQKAINWGKAGLAVTLPSLVAYAFNYDEEWYQKAPRWKKNMFLLIPVGRDKDGHMRVLALPRPHELGLILGALPERFMDHWFLKDPEAVKSVLNQIAGTSNLSFEQFFSQWLPPISAFTNARANYDAFKGTPIEHAYDIGHPKHLRYSRGTSDFLVWASNWIHKETGIEHQQYSPAQVDYILRTSFAGWADYGLDVADMVTNLIRNDEKKVADDAWYYRAPVSRAFMSKEPWPFSQNADDFYLYAERSEQAHNAVKSVGKYGNRDGALAEYAVDGEWVHLYPLFQKAQQQIQPLSALIRALYETEGKYLKMSPEERRDELMQLRTGREKIFTQAVNWAREKLPEARRMVEERIEREKGR